MHNKSVSNLDQFILDILSNDWENVAIIQAELNNTSDPSLSVKIDNDNYYLDKNNGKKFEASEIKKSLIHLLETEQVEVKRHNIHSDRLELIDVAQSKDLDWENDWFKANKLA